VSFIRFVSDHKRSQWPARHKRWCVSHKRVFQATSDQVNTPLRSNKAMWKQKTCGHTGITIMRPPATCPWGSAQASNPGLMSINLRKNHCQSVAVIPSRLPTIQARGAHKLSRWGSGLALILFGMWLSSIRAKS